MQHLAAKPPQPSKLYLLQAVLSQKAEGLLLWSLTLKEPGKLPQITMSLLKKGRLDGWMDGWHLHVICKADRSRLRTI